MNYLAHAIEVLDAPWIVAGTSLPDWLRVVDKRLRLKPATLLALPLEHRSAAHQLRAGVIRHHDDDTKFHTDPRFDELSHEAVSAVRALSPDPRLRASALGHILVEMLLDAALDEANPGTLERYYQAIDDVDARELAAIVGRWSSPLHIASVARIPELLERFRRARFLFSYRTDDGVVDSLEGVCWRAGLAPPPPGTVDVVARMRPLVRAAATVLLSH